MDAVRSGEQGHPLEPDAGAVAAYYERRAVFAHDPRSVTLSEGSRLLERLGVWLKQRWLFRRLKRRRALPLGLAVDLGILRRGFHHRGEHFAFVVVVERGEVHGRVLRMGRVGRNDRGWSAASRAPAQMKSPPATLVRVGREVGIAVLRRTPSPSPSPPSGARG